MSSKTTSPEAIFFDLDGTLFDTAPDLAFALNEVLQQHQKATVTVDALRPHAGTGSRSMIQFGFNIDEQDAGYEQIKTQFLNCYAKNLLQETEPYPGMLDVLDYLDQHQIPWGIVTNKPEWLTLPLLEHYQLHQRSRCLVAGDTLAQRKPHPAPLHHACKLTQTNASNCIYIGDTETDMQAAKAAEMFAILALYGYQPPNAKPDTWHSDFSIQAPRDLLAWVDKTFLEKSP